MKSTSPKESKRSPIRFSVGFLNNPALFTAGNMAYSDFYQLRIPGYRLFVVTDPQVIRHILVQQKAKYQKSKMYWKQLRAIIGRGMGSLDGEEWLFLRKLQNPYFLKSRVSQYLETVPPATEIHLQQWRQWSGQTIDIIPLISRLNTQILLQCLFGMQAADSYAEIARRIADGQATISWRSKYPWRPMTGWLNGRNQRAQQHLNFFDRFLEDQLSRIDPEADNLFNALHQSPQLQPTDLRNELIIHLGAGTETAAVSEAWALYLLAKNPDILGRVRKEISDLAGDQPLQAQHAFQLPLTEQVIKESARLFPPSYAYLRDCIEEDTIQGIRIRKGDSFFLSIYALHRHPRYWEQPETFFPERFSNLDSDLANQIYLPYGAGNHRCIGQYLATPMMVLSLAAICRNFDFELDHPADKVPQSLSTLKPKGGMPLKITSKQ